MPGRSGGPWKYVLPPGTVARGRTVRVFYALLRVYERDGQALISTVAREADRSISTTWLHIQRLIDAGFVAHEAAGALRPLYRPVGIRR